MKIRNFILLAFAMAPSISFAQSQLGEVTVNESTRCAQTSIGELCDGMPISSELLSAAYDTILGEKVFQSGALFSQSATSKLPPTTVVSVITRIDATNMNGAGLLKDGAVRTFPSNTNHLLIISKEVSLNDQFGGLSEFTLGAGDSAMIILGENTSGQNLTKINLQQNRIIAGARTFLFDAISLESAKAENEPQPYVFISSESGGKRTFGVLNGRILINYRADSINIGTYGGFCQEGGSVNSILLYNAYSAFAGNLNGIYGNYTTCGKSFSFNLYNAILRFNVSMNNYSGWGLGVFAFDNVENSIIDGMGSSFTNMWSNRITINAVNSYVTNFGYVKVGAKTNNGFFFNNDGVGLGGGGNISNAILYNNKGTNVCDVLGRRSGTIKSTLFFNNDFIPWEDSGYTNCTATKDGNSKITDFGFYYAYSIDSIPGFVSMRPSCSTDTTTKGRTLTGVTPCSFDTITKPFISSGLQTQ